ncbi:MAG: N-6 DNA methylase [Pseudomonadota bacterium]
MTNSATIRQQIFSLADRDAPRTEAMIQADVRQLLLIAPLNLDIEDLHDIVLESPLGDRRRIDIEMGSTVIEVKKDLRKGSVRAEAVEQLYGYVSEREHQSGHRYIGLLTDGAEWACYRASEGELKSVSTIVVNAANPEVDEFLVWLEGVLATATAISPAAREIRARLGVGSSSHALDKASIKSLYEANKDEPSVKLKRSLWSKLLTSALGTQFDGSDDLFVEHTLLVNSAEIIAHAVIGLPVESLPPISLLSGSKFDESGVHGVVEQDFFDWVLEVDGGQAFVRSLARRLGRFDWSVVEQDVLKVLYESVIGAATRKRLGEYYTPDWLANQIVEKTVDDPLNQRVLDPACGSGTFLFHAVRRYLRAAEQKLMPLDETLTQLTQHVIGLELHPVAVTLARVTYLLAIGRSRLTDPNRGEIQVPVFLGDSVQWREQQTDLLSKGTLTIETDDGVQLFSDELKFPDNLLNNAGTFDQLVQEMADRAANRKAGSPVPSLSGIFQRLAISTADQPALRDTFRIMCDLHDQGRDHIWGYYVRNLARPMWLAQSKNRVDRLIGNPPWLAYRHMPPDMQAVFRSMSESRGLWHGAAVATQQDLSALFAARSCQLYLRDDGDFAFVMPNAVVDRGQYSGFRSGEFPDSVEPVAVSFTPSWDLRKLRPHFFPRGASVIFGKKSKQAVQMPAQIESWQGKLPGSDAHWSEVEPCVSRITDEARIFDTTIQSAYKARFANGAILSPRLLFMVEERDASPLGVPAGRKSIKSSRSANEKKPWKALASFEGTVETEFVRPLYSGESLLPYSMMAPLQVIVPWNGTKLLGSSDEDLELYIGLADWWRAAEECWEKHRSSDRLTLLEQLDYHSKLSKQFPIPKIRVVYNKSGMHLSAAIVTNKRAVVSNGLYWAAAASMDEAHYICAFLNSPVTTELVRPLMSYGKDERHIDKYVWGLPLPEFSSHETDHIELSGLGEEAAQLAGSVETDSSKHFSAQRRAVRNALSGTAACKRIDEIIYDLLS